MSFINGGGGCAAPFGAARLRQHAYGAGDWSLRAFAPLMEL